MMVYNCLHCKYKTGNRKSIRKHVREAHNIRGKPLAIGGKNKYLPSEISEAYVRK